MGNILFLENADFSNNNIGRSKIRKLDLVTWQTGVDTSSVEDVADVDPSSYITESQPSDSGYIVYKTNRISEIIELDQNAKQLYGIMPLIVAKSVLSKVVNFDGNPFGVGFPYMYYYNENTESWKGNQLLTGVFDIYKIKENIYLNKNFCLVLGKFKLTYFTPTAHNFFMQWQVNGGEAIGLGMDKPELYLEME